jgi:hypothetical protein
MVNDYVLYEDESEIATGDAEIIATAFFAKIGGALIVQHEGADWTFRCGWPGKSNWDDIWIPAENEQEAWALFVERLIERSADNLVSVADRKKASA